VSTKIGGEAKAGRDIATSEDRKSAENECGYQSQ
jgi:hypothetical protein